MKQGKETKRCLGCNSRFETVEEVSGPQLLDPKKELCDKCYLKLDEHDEATIILELGVKVKKSSLSEIIQYVEDFACYTTDIESYGLKFKLPDKKTEEEM